jgi:hypothetical protein
MPAPFLDLFLSKKYMRIGDMSTPFFNKKALFQGNLLPPSVIIISEGME